MKTKQFSISAILLVLSCCLVAEEVYKTVDEEGRVRYSSEGSESAEKVKLRESNTIVMPKPKPKSAESEEVQKKGYKSLSFTEPAEPVTEIRGEPVPYELNVSVVLEPSLQSDLGHRFQFYLNGEPHGDPVAGSTMKFENLFRGSYNIGVAVVDTANKDKVLIRGEDIVVNVRQAAVPRSAPSSSSGS